MSMFVVNQQLCAAIVAYDTPVNWYALCLCTKIPDSVRSRKACFYDNPLQMTDDAE